MKRSAAARTARLLAQRQQRRTKSTLAEGNASPVCEVTTLPSGLRVATEPTPGHFGAVGVYVDAGSRFDWDGTLGYAHLLDRMAFKSTAKRTMPQMMAEIEALGGQFYAASSRETMIYQSATYLHSLDRVVSILSDTVLNGTITDEELEAERDSVAYEVREFSEKADVILPEIAHEVAYYRNTLGRPLLCPPEALPNVTTAGLRAYKNQWYRPERIVVAGAGVQHTQLVDLVKQHFGAFALEAAASSSTRPNICLPSATPTPRKQPPASKQFLSTSSTSSAAFAPDGLVGLDGAPSFETLANASAHYTGGSRLISKPDAEFTHIYIAYEGVSASDPDVYALAVVQVMLGGGSSFSAGGPGKGMYSRLYTQVLNFHHAVDFCASFYHSYADSGLFGISIASTENFLKRAPGVVAQQLDVLTRPAVGQLPVTEIELARAKRQLKSSLLMAMESKIVLVEDMGRQVQARGFKEPVDVLCAKIDAVTLKDIFRVATRVLRPTEPGRSGEPTIVVQGKLDQYQDVRQALKSHGLAP